MDIEKLIEQLSDFNENHIAVLCGSGQCACGYLCDKDDCIVVRAATALSTLQAENESLKEKLYDGEGVNLVDYWMQQAKIEENGNRNCQAENEKLRAELNDLKAQWDMYGGDEGITATFAELEQVKKKNKYSAHDVALILSDAFGDSCACNFNGNDEWLPEKCELLDTCPDVNGVACWEQYLKWRGQKED